MIEKLVNSKKIAIFGFPASGKSTLGIFLSEFLEIKLYSLDIRFSLIHLLMNVLRIIKKEKKRITPVERKDLILIY